MNVEENKRLAIEAEHAKNVFDALATKKGPISAALNQGTEEISQAKTKGEKNAIRERTLEAVKSAIIAELERTTLDAGAGQPHLDQGSAGLSPESPASTATLSAHEGRGDTEPAGLNQEQETEARSEQTALPEGQPPAPESALPAPKPPTPHFTGIDSHGHKWVNGKQVKREEETPSPESSSPAAQPLFDALAKEPMSYKDMMGTKMYDDSRIA